ncbi:MAG: hypothetical protein Unbinned3325contig1000_7 [Prokaryotic dsDNA virus sp.]|nr:MAG: hypothetical protein Unbinned3325contig1000_7 [Prokaryotic dsDNA virus sp.]|tara:strand:- start:5606 stop:5881 length:276 start_codon:yes stop_codon:yes gene_type:complete
MKKEIRVIDIDWVNDVKELTQNNNHTDARLLIAKLLDSKAYIKFYSAIKSIQDFYGYKPYHLSQLCNDMEKPFMRYIKNNVENYDDFYNAL